MGTDRAIETSSLGVPSGGNRPSVQRVAELRCSRFGDGETQLTSTKGRVVKKIPNISLPGEVGGKVGKQKISLDGTTLIVFFDSTESEF